MAEVKLGKARASVEDQVNVSLKRYPRVYDYFVDFFGILIPGVTFWLLFLLMLYGLYYCWASTWRDNCVVPLAEINTFRWELVFFSIVISYILGFLFFRKGPKEVDIKSIKAQYKSIKDDNPPIKGSAELKLEKATDHPKGYRRIYDHLKRYLIIKLPIKSETEPNYTTKIDYSKDFQWPYEYLKRYLNYRLPHLAKLVPWEPPKPANKNKSEKLTNNKNSKDQNGDEQPADEAYYRRSKMFINVLKDNIKFYFPDKYLDVARNEALVRLSSSIWYAMKYLLYLACFSLATVFVLLYINYKFVKPHEYIDSGKLFIYLTNALFFIVIILAAIYIRRQIKKVLFYQRIREIVYILNTAFQACKRNPDFGLEFFKAKIWKYEWFERDPINNTSTARTPIFPWFKQRSGIMNESDHD